MSRLRVAAELSLPDDALTQTFGILAKRGVGKTYTSAVMTEEMLKAGLQVVVVDPIGVWWGLRAAANGKDPGLPIVVMGGDHGDVPLEAGAGKVIAEFVVDERQAVVLDLSLLRKGEQVRFMTDFAETLYHRNRAPLHVVLDEADAFAPQRPMKGQERMLGAVEDLVRRGRARGIGITLVTQRAAVLNKDVLTQVEVLIALRTIAPQDREAIDAWIRVHGTPKQREELMASLPSLPIGTAWFWSPGWLDVFKRVQVRRRETFDSSATPQVGARAQEPKQLAGVDLEALKKRIASTIEKAKAEDPRELRRRISELEAQLRKEPAAAPAKEKRVEVLVLKDTQIARLDGTVEKLADVATGMGVAAREIAEALHRWRNGTAPKTEPAAIAAARRPMVQPAPRASVPAGPGDLEVGTGGLRRMLIALAQRPQGLSARQLGVRAGLSSKSGTFDTYLSRARRQDWITGDRTRLVITRAGLTAVGPHDPLPEGRELLAHWLRELGTSGAARMLAALVDAYPKALTRGELAEASHLTGSSGTFDTYLSRLRALELVEGKGGLRAAEEFFA